MDKAIPNKIIIIGAFGQGHAEPRGRLHEVRRVVRRRRHQYENPWDLIQRFVSSQFLAAGCKSIGASSIEERSIWAAILFTRISDSL